MLWDFNPVLVKFGQIRIHYYGVIFALGIFIGYLLWRWQTKRQNFSEEQTEDFVLWGFLAVIIGARLGHCLFYQPHIYLPNPLRILRFWEGGLSSHGATIALLIVLYLYHRRHNLKLTDVTDCFSFSAAVGSIAVRIGNFFNSEIVGRVTNVPWGIKFPLYEAQSNHFAHLSFQQLCEIAKPRPPSQLYEAFLGIIVLASLLIADRCYGTKRPKGLLSALFLTLYFGGRIFVEFFKEYQTEGLEASLGITMGQILSAPFFLAGVIWLLQVVRNPIPSELISQPKQEASSIVQPTNSNKKEVKAKKRKK